MKRERRQKFQQAKAAQVVGVTRQEEKRAEAPSWPGEQLRYLPVFGMALIVLGTILIYAQTIRVPAIDYEDSYYLLRNPYVNVAAPFSRLGEVWNEPYFANFHPVTTTTWLIDRALADKSRPFDALPFRLFHLFYAVAGAALLIPLYRRLGLPSILAVLGALLYAVHPIHTEVVAWLSARKDLVALIFILLSFLAWLWARDATTPDQWRLRHALTVVMVMLAVLSKPIAVILPALFVAYEFCSAPHEGILRWSWAKRHRHPFLTRTLALTGIFLMVGGVSALIFRSLLSLDPTHGGWLIFVPIALMPFALALAPPAADLAASREGRSSGARVLGPPIALLGLVFGAGSAWTLWAQGQVGAIKGGLTLLPTLNLTFDAMLAYAGKALVPAYMRTSYVWNAYPYVSFKGLMGAALVGALIWIGMRQAGSPDRNLRLMAFGIFWYLIAFVPVSNLVPTSTKMADRYLFVPTVGAVLALLALAAWFSSSRRRQGVVCAALALVVVPYMYASYQRAEVWCGKTTPWRGRPDPDLSLWTSAVETDPEDLSAPVSLALVYLRFNPPEADQALVYLQRALQLSQASQARVVGGKQLDLSPLYEALGDAYLAQASGLAAGSPASDVWRQKKGAFAGSVKYFQMASRNPSGFAPADARLLCRLAEACEGQAQMDAQELDGAMPGQRAALISERDALRSKSEASVRRAREILRAGRVPPSDPEFRAVMIVQGNIIFARETGASNDEKAGYYREALVRYQEAAALFPDDPRPFLYQGLCYERLTAMAQSPQEKQSLFALGEAALRKALTLPATSPDYSPAMPYHGLALLYSHLNDFPAALESLKKELEVDPAYAESTHVRGDIQGLEQYLARQGKTR